MCDNIFATYSQDEEMRVSVLTKHWPFDRK